MALVKLFVVRFRVSIGKGDMFINLNLNVKCLWQRATLSVPTAEYTHMKVIERLRVRETDNNTNY